jgi:hypothetical protein
LHLRAFIAGLSLFSVALVGVGVALGLGWLGTLLLVVAGAFAAQMLYLAWVVVMVRAETKRRENGGSGGLGAECVNDEPAASGKPDVPVANGLAHRG